MTVSPSNGTQAKDDADKVRSRRSFSIRVVVSSETASPVVDVFLHLILGVAVSGLDLALQLFAVAIDFGDVVVSELAPLLFHLAGKLLPVSFNPIPVHGVLLWRLTPQLTIKERNSISLVPHYRQRSRLHPA